MPNAMQPTLVRVVARQSTATRPTFACLFTHESSAPTTVKRRTSSMGCATIHIHEHFTDTHGDTTHVFGLCAALGFRFGPRVRDVFDERLFTIGRPEHDYGPFNPAAHRFASTPASSSTTGTKSSASARQFATARSRLR